MTDSLKAGDDAAASVATAPRVTLESLEQKIAKTEFAVFGGVLTICVLTTTNGFLCVGESACAAPENFNRELGEKFAREAAVRRLWGFEGYALRERLAAGEQPAPGAAHAPPPSIDPKAKFEAFPDSYDAWSPEQVLEFEDWFVALPADAVMPAFANKAVEDAWGDAVNRLSGDNGGPAGAVETPPDPEPLPDDATAG